MVDPLYVCPGIRLFFFFLYGNPCPKRGSGKQSYRPRHRAPSLLRKHFPLANFPPKNPISSPRLVASTPFPSLSHSQTRTLRLPPARPSPATMQPRRRQQQQQSILSFLQKKPAAAAGEEGATPERPPRPPAASVAGIMERLVRPQRQQQQGRYGAPIAGCFYVTRPSYCEWREAARVLGVVVWGPSQSGCGKAFGRV